MSDLDESEGGSEEGGAEEEEALSLSDLPLPAADVIDKDQNLEGREGETEEFDFVSLIGSVKKFHSEMCSADEVFFRGQMLPFRHSISSDASGFRNPGSRSLSRSESMDRGSASGIRSSSLTSSRSSSTRSHHSSSTSTSSSASNNPKFRNQFHSYPSPTPQIRASSTRSAPNSVPSRKSSSSSSASLWEFLRLGLVRAPELELLDFKTRTHHRTSYSKSGPIISRSSSNGSNNGNNNGDSRLKSSNQRAHEKTGGIFGGCKCLTLAVEPIPVNGGSSSSTAAGKGGMTKGDDRKMTGTGNLQWQKGQGSERKRAVSRRRTFEWLKELPHTHTVVLNPTL